MPGTDHPATEWDGTDAVGSAASVPEGNTMTMGVAAGVYLVAMLLVLWAGSRRIGSRWAYLIASVVLLIVGALAIILTPSSGHTGLEPARSWFSSLSGSGGWIGGGLLLVGFAALGASLMYRGPSPDVSEELDS